MVRRSRSYGIVIGLGVGLAVLGLGGIAYATVNPLVPLQPLPPAGPVPQEALPVEPVASESEPDTDVPAAPPSPPPEEIHDDLPAQPPAAEAPGPAAAPSGSSPTYIWPLDAAHLLRVGQGLGADRLVNGVFDHSHQGRDLFGRRIGGEPVPVVFPVDSVIRGVYDFRLSPEPKKRRAGLTVEAFELGPDGQPAFLWRFLHLGTYAPELEKGRRVQQGDLVGTLAPPGTSGIGLGTGEHLHLERRIWPPPAGQTYGEALDPLAVLPPLQEAV